MKLVAFSKTTQWDYASRFVRQHDWWVSPSEKWADARHIGYTMYCSLEGGNDGSPIGEAVGLPEYPAFKDAELPLRPLGLQQAFARSFVELALSLFPGISPAEAGDLAMRQVKQFDRLCGWKTGFYSSHYPFKHFGDGKYDAYEILRDRCFLIARPSATMVTARVAAQLRHRQTQYDALRNEGVGREEARRKVQPIVSAELNRLRVGAVQAQ